MARQAVAKAEPAPVISPTRAALMKVAQNFQVDLTPYPESALALAFKADAAGILAKGITTAETHRTALLTMREGKRLTKGITEHWARVTRWLEERKRDIRTIAAMDLEHVEPGVKALNVAVLRYEDAEKERVRLEEDRQRREQQRLAQAQREQELAAMEQQALAAEGQSDDLSGRERAFVMRCYAGLGVDLTSPRWLNAAAAACGFKQDGYGALLFARPKIQAALDGLRSAQALREQSAAVAEKPIEVRAPEVQINTAKVAGTRTVTTWTCECVDVNALIDAVLQGTADRKLLMFNQVEGNALARSLHDNVDRIPGLRHKKSVTKAG